jgi:transglutaminase-like putative cysteine protease
MLATLGECLDFPPGPAAFLWARDRLIRPREVSPITAAIAARWTRSSLPYADEVALWLWSAFQAGALRYIPDPPGRNDFWCSPRSVLERGGDDCDGLSVLVASILLGAGCAATVRVGTYGTDGHAWVEGVDDAGPFLIETTAPGTVHRIRPPEYQPYGLVEILS